ncbi:ribonuclease H-like domain-containing protein [Tanacetum coccineum]
MLQPPPPSSTDKIIPFSIPNKVLDLEKHNYNSWSSFSLIHLGSLDLKSHVEQENASTNPEWCQFDDLIKMWILGSLSDSLQEQVVTTPGNAKALWDHLKDLFHDNKDDRAINLDNELPSIKIGKMTMNEYCTKIKSMVNRLKNLDCQVSEKNLVIYAVNGLDSRFATLVEIIHHREPLPTFETIRNMLLLKESSFNDESGATNTFESSSSSPTVLIASSYSNTKGVNMVHSMWLFKHKFHVDGTLSRYKARLVANGSSVQLGVNFNETFSSVVKPVTIRMVLSLAVSRHWPIHQLDVKNAFLNGDLSETVYMHQPLGFFDSRYPHHVAYLLIYVDAIILTASSPDLLHQIIASLHNEFDMTGLEALNYFLCISADRTPIGIPVQDPTLYRSFARGLRYLTFAHPDLSYVVHRICLYMHDPREPHFAIPQTYLAIRSGDYGLWSPVHTLSRLSVEAKYHGVANVVAETAWLLNLLRELHAPLSTATIVYCDNVSVVYMSANPVQHQQTKHIDIDIHFVCDMVTAGQVRVLHVPSSYQYTDIFTKGLLLALFEYFRYSLSVRSSPAQTVHVTGGSEVTLSSSLGTRDYAASCVHMHFVLINIYIFVVYGHGKVKVNVDVNETTQSVIVVLGSVHNGKYGRGELLGIINHTTHGCYFSIFQQATPIMCARVRFKWKLAVKVRLEHTVVMNSMENAYYTPFA